MTPLALKTGPGDLSLRTNIIRVSLLWKKRMSRESIVHQSPKQILSNRITGRVIALSSIMLMLGGCAHYGAVHFVTDPPGAEVVNLRDDTSLGMTPVKVWWSENDSKPKHVTVQFNKDGYKERITNIWVNMRHGTKQEALANAKPVKIELQKRGGE